MEYLNKKFCIFYVLYYFVGKLLLLWLKENRCCEFTKVIVLSKSWCEMFVFKLYCIQNNYFPFINYISNIFFVEIWIWVFRFARISTWDLKDSLTHWWSDELWRYEFLLPHSLSLSIFLSLSLPLSLSLCLSLTISISICPSLFLWRIYGRFRLVGYWMQSVYARSIIHLL